MSAIRYAFAAAMIGLACAAPAEAPWGGWDKWQPGTGYSSTTPPPPAATAPSPAASSGYNNMQGAGTYSSVNLANVPVQSGNPFSFPLSNGFPNLNAQQLAVVNQLAQGTEPNGGAPTLAADDLISVQLIAFNEIFEVAYFTDLLFNVTNNVDGYTVADPKERQKLINALVAIQAQEELHADNANAILSANKIAPIQPCQYKFPVSDLASAISLASTFTDVVLGTLQDVQLRLAMNNDDGVVPIIGSVIGQEGEQNGFFRNYVDKIPSAKPFLTRSSREFAFSALNQNFVVSGSCPNINTIPLPIFLPLTVVTSPIAAQDQTITFSAPVDPTNNGVALVLINGQNTPLVEPVQSTSVANSVATFTVNFPFTANVLDGLTIAALVNSTANLASAEDVAKVTVNGPGLIEIN